MGRDNCIDPLLWYDFYSAKDWMIGKNKMNDWKAAVRTWERKEQQKEQRRTEPKYADLTGIGMGE